MPDIARKLVIPAGKNKGQHFSVASVHWVFADDETTAPWETSALSVTAGRGGGIHGRSASICHSKWVYIDHNHRAAVVVATTMSAGMDKLHPLITEQIGV